MITTPATGRSAPFKASPRSAKGLRSGPRAVLVTAMIAALAAVGLVAAAGPAGAASGEFVSAATFGGPGLDEGRGVVVDADGNVYTTGTFRGTVDFDPGVGVVNRASRALSDGFVSKLDSNGQLLWVVTFGGSSNDEGRSVTLDTTGDVIISGFFAGTVDFDPGPGVLNRTSAGGTDVFVLKLDSNGQFVWATSFGGTGADEGRSVAVDAAGNVLTTGTFRDVVDFNPGPGIVNRTSAGGTDVFVLKLDSNRQFVWAATFGSTLDDHGASVVVDATGNVLTTGIFFGVVDFDPGPGVVNRASGILSNVFVSKLDSNGQFVWAATFGSNGFDLGRGVAVDAAGDVLVTGTFSGTVDFDPGPGVTNRTATGTSNVFVSKIDSDGQFLWVATLVAIDGSALAVDAADNVYITGAFSGTPDFDPGPGVATRTAAGGRDVFVWSLDSNGQFGWVAAFGGTGNDEGRSVAVDAAVNLHTTGFFAGIADFDPGPGVATRTAASSSDVFVSKLSPEGLCNGMAVTVDIGAGDLPTVGGDVILGTPGNDVINGLGGNDLICGAGGDDTIFGGPGNDRIFGNDGNDGVFGGDGDDFIFGGDGNDGIQGNGGNDLIDGGDGSDTLSGNDGSDTILGGVGNETIFGGAGTDTIYGNEGQDTVLGGLGNDSIQGGADDDLISGNAGDDSIEGGSGDDTLYGVDGTDTIVGGAGNDIIVGGSGDDTIFGVDGNDIIAGNDGDDTIVGADGDDEIFGGEDNDALSGGAGDDLMLSGNGNDTISGGAGNDLLSGNGGDDFVDGGANDDEVYGADGNDELVGGTGQDIILGGNGNDDINTADTEEDLVSGNAGTDTCTRDPGLDTIFACEILLP